MPKLHKTGRLAALVGIGAVLSTATLVAVAPLASAADTQQTSCTEQVRVRSEPNASAPVVGSCGAGERVTAGESRDGFTKLASKNGWVSSDYVKDATSRDSDSDDDRYDNDRDGNRDGYNNDNRYDRDRYDNDYRYNNNYYDRDRDRGRDGILGGGL
ncbi:MAG TPA: SH3 domain-containing protein [Pseudonocardia sp.]|jgi:hypothetical protein|nr:SH3 domain-containing protein [Pseudonocardia sp.]